MGDIVLFTTRKLGCKGCVHLIRCGKTDWMCEDRTYLDDTTVFPVLDGKRTDGWGICDGESYERCPFRSG